MPIVAQVSFSRTEGSSWGSEAGLWGFPGPLEVNCVRVGWRLGSPAASRILQGLDAGARLRAGDPWPLGSFAWSKQIRGPSAITEVDLDTHP